MSKAAGATGPAALEMLEPRVLFSATPTGEISRDYWTGIAGSGVADLTGQATYPGSPTGSDTLTKFEAVDWNNPATTSNFANDYGERIRGYLVAPTTGDYTFWISGDNHAELWLSSDHDAGNRALMAWNASGGQYQWNVEANQKSAVVSLVAGQKYFIEALHKESGIDDHLAVGWLKPGEVGTAPSEIIPGSALSVWNAPPVAGDDSIVVFEGVVSSNTVDSNDTDADNDPLSYALGTDAAHGTVSLADDGSFTYTPTAAYLGPDSFTYTVDDGQGNTSSATVSLSVNPSLPDTIYEDAQNGNTVGWYVAGNNPTGASIHNVFDTDLNSQVIELSGAGTSNQYRLRSDQNGDWNNTSQFVIEWKMKISETYAIYVSVDTSAGHRWIQYTNRNTDSLGTGGYVHHGLGVESLAGAWQTFERDLLADLHDAQPGVTILDVNRIAINGSGRFDDIKLKDQLTDPNALPTVKAGALVNAATFSGADTVAAVDRINQLGDDYVPIDDPSKSYRIVGEARSGDGAGGSYDPNNRQYFGFNAYDIDLNQINRAHTQRVTGSTDTTLAQALNPGDTQIHLTDATGWYNLTSSGLRSLAWYGYTDATGHTYDDYTYTRNVQSNLWDEGAVVGNTITLRDPWAGPALASGDAVRNAYARGAYIYNAVSNRPITQDWSFFASTTLSGVNQSGLTNEDTKFRPGTAFIKPLMLMNWHGNTGNLVTYRNVRVVHTDSASVEEGSTVPLVVSANDSDDDPITLTWTQTAGPAVTLDDIHSATPTFTAPIVAASQALTFQVAVTAGDHTIYDTIDIVVDNAAGPNTDPVATDDAATTDEETAVAIAVLDNDSDVNGDPIDIASFTQPTNGTVTRVGDQLTYTPALNHFGSDSFTYTLTDGNAGSATAAVNLTVNNLQDAPAAAAATFTLDEDAAVTAAVTATDADGDTLTYTLLGAPALGTVQLGTDGNFTYTPHANAHGSDSFTYTADDGHGNTSAATVNLTVTSANDLPQAGHDTFAVTRNTVLHETVVGNDADADADTLTYTINTQPQHGQIIFNDDGGFAFQPTTNYAGLDSFTYTLADGQGGSDSATVILDIDGVGTRPPVTPFTATAASSTPTPTSSTATSTQNGLGGLAFNQARFNSPVDFGKTIVNPLRFNTRYASPQPQSVLVPENAGRAFNTTVQALDAGDGAPSRTPAIAGGQASGSAASASASADAAASPTADAPPQDAAIATDAVPPSQELPPDAVPEEKDRNPAPDGEILADVPTEEGSFSPLTTLLPLGLLHMIRKRRQKTTPSRKRRCA